MIPFPGLSVLIHFLIILGRKISETFHLQSRFKFAKNGKVSYMMTFLTVIAVLVLVSANAFFLLWFSFNNNSNYYLVEKMLSNRKNDISIPGMISVSAENIEKTDCAAGSFSGIYDNPEFSIVDFLGSNGLDNSFENRALMAENYGIGGYVGSEEQNIKLLSILKSNQNFSKNCAMIENK
jgi:hypothetical protein